MSWLARLPHPPSLRMLAWGVAAALFCLAQTAQANESQLTIHGSGASLPAHVYARASLIYGISAHANASLLYEVTGSSAGLQLLQQGKVDFAASDHVNNLPSDLQAVPTVAAAVVCLFNVEGIGGVGQRLILDAAAIAGIFLGTIDRWDDPMLTALNPTLSLPAQPVTVVVRAGSSGTSNIFTTALSALNATFASQVGNSTSPTWPVPEGRLVKASKSTGVSNAVLVTPFSIGYNGLSQARERGIPYASFLTSEAKVAEPGPSSLQKTMVTFVPGGFGAVVNEDLVESAVAPSGSATNYPFVGYSYLVLRKSYMRTNTSCATRIATRAFWTWFMTSSTAADLAGQLGFATVPTFVNQQVLELMQGAFTCDFTNTSTSDDSQALFGGYGPAALATSFSYLELSFRGKSSVRMEYTATNASVVPPSFAGSQLFAVHVRDATTGWLPPQPGITGAGTDQEVTTAPFGAAALLVAYHVSWLPAGSPLILSVETAAEIFLGDIVYWDHSHILSENPHTAGSFPHTAIKLVIPQDESASTLIASQRFVDASAAFRQHHGGAFKKWTDVPPGTIQAADSSTASAYVSTTEASISFLPEEYALRITVGIGVASMLVVRNGVSEVITFSNEAAVQCSDGATTPNARYPEACWPFAGRLLLSYASRFHSVSGCSHGRALAKFLSWAYSQPVQHLLGDTGVAGVPPTVRDLVATGLNNIRCDGTSILRPLPECTVQHLQFTVGACQASSITQEVSFQWNPAMPCRNGIELPASIHHDCDHVPWGSKTSVVITVFCLLGAGTVCGLVAWVLKHKTEEIVRYMQPTFSLLFLIGSAGALLSTISLVGSNTDSWCLARTWLLEVPTSIAFAALYAKMYRVWRIFAHRFKRVTISNYKLLRVVTIIVVPILLLLALQTLFGPPVAVITSQQLAFGATVDTTSCGTDLSIIGLLLVVAQALLLVLGLFLSYQTWNVPTTVAESRPMAIAIGNIGFVLVLVGFLTNFFNAAPAAKIALRAFGIWSAMVVAVATVFGPRVWAYYRHPKTGRHRPVPERSASGSVSGRSTSGRARGGSKRGMHSRTVSAGASLTGDWSSTKTRTPPRASPPTAPTTAQATTSDAGASMPKRHALVADAVGATSATALEVSSVNPVLVTSRPIPTHTVGSRGHKA